ncbi:A/G-specific adenine glycosylase [Uliginosibacterium sediminicola]|uniref:Adenine DNA glycosylase n=1 Tax=Uliginosibacterium sediminicola TaxID=2024550 RepID=A0ABU9YXY6_9RHOO
MTDAHFAPTLIRWQASHGRHDLPWQKNRDPYRVWLSEIMLQQTQVDTVQPYYLRFLQRFPDVATLAAAPLDDVLAHWSGLGYYARARNLHRAAQRVVSEFGGQFPRRAEVLQSLPGIGRSTAAAIAAVCFGERVAILDGNVKRVLTRHFGIHGFPGERAIEQQLWALAESLVPEHGAELYPQALMDLGATLCTRSKPACLHCPVQASCVACKEGLQGALPTPRPKKAVPQRSARVLVLRHARAVLLEQRPPSGIWGGLYSLPELAAGETLASGLLRLLGQTDAADSIELPEVLHVFTHFKLSLQPELVELSPPPQLHAPGLRWIALDALDAVGLPAPIRKILEAL